MSKNNKKPQRSKRNRSQERFVANLQAIQEGPSLRKNFSTHDLEKIYPFNKSQEDVFYQYGMSSNLLLTGSAGTGKTLLACYLGIRDVLEKKAEKLVIIRSAVPSRDMGFLPGDLNEKMAVFEEPYEAIFDQIFKFSKSYQNLKHLGLIEFHTSSYLRGITFDHSVVVFDEAQNATFQEIDTILTRIGLETRFMLCGDSRQCDLASKKTKEYSGLEEIRTILKSIRGVSEIEFSADDIVRSGFVRDYIIAKENSTNNEKVTRLR